MDTTQGALKSSNVGFLYLSVLPMEIHGGIHLALSFWIILLITCLNVAPGPYSHQEGDIEVTKHCGCL